MATRHELSKPKKLSHHYGKRTSTFKKSMSSFATTLSTATTPERPISTRQRVIATSASTTNLDDSSPEPLNLPAPVQTNASIHSSGKSTSSERKRKRYEVYSMNAEEKDPLQSSDDGSPLERPARRSRVSSPETSSHMLRAGAHTTARQLRSTSADAMDVDSIGGKLSSPPPTPALLKDRRKELSKKDLPFSPNTMHAFDKMSVTKASQKKTQPRRQQVPASLANRNSSKPNPSVTSVPRSVSAPGTGGNPQVLGTKQPLKPRKRLVDRLLEQDEESPEKPDEPDIDDSSQRSGSQVTFSEPVSSQTSGTSVVVVVDSQLSQTSNSRRTAKDSSLRTYSRSNSGLKRTFGQGQKVTLLEEDPFDALDMPLQMTPTLKGRRLEVSTPKKLVKSNLDVEDDESSINPSPKAKMRDIYELRQAGANSRAADEMSDLSDQLGKPSSIASSSRRTTLLQIADRIREKDFRRRLRDYGVEAMMFKDIGEEGDIISGYLICAILAHILASSPSPNIVRFLRAGDAGALFGRMLEVNQDLKKLAKDRKSNLSKRSQASLAAIQVALLALPFWKTKPQQISSRTLALQCLNLLVTQDNNVGKEKSIFPATVSNGLFHVLAAANETDFWDEHEPDFTGKVDVQCALTVLEYHAVKAMEAHGDEHAWMAHHLSVVADIFGAALQQTTTHNNELVSSVLKLVLNMTNSNTAAPGIFVDKGSLPTLAISVCDSFSEALQSVAKEEFAEGVLDGLVLRLGILINFAEKSMSVRQEVYENHGEAKSPIRELIRLFLENHQTTADADSEAKSQLNVAFGYLSVLLGYLSLYPPARQVFRESHSSRSMGPLLDSIREFLTHHKVMEASLREAMEDEPMMKESSYTDRLQSLVDQLERDAAVDY